MGESLWAPSYMVRQIDFDRLCAIIIWGNSEEDENEGRAVKASFRSNGHR